MIWIEILSRHHDVLARHRIDADEARIGRAYDNDIVLDDPFVAAHHVLVFRADDGVLIAQDLDSANGMYDASGRRVVHAALDGRRPVRIGRTLLRVRDAAFAVPAERREVMPSRNGRVAAALALGVLALTLFELWLAETGEWRTSTWLAPLILYVALVVAWTTGWALLNRLFAGAARFATHLAIALAAALAMHVFDWIVDVATYSLASRSVAEWAYVGTWAIVGAAAFLHLVVIGPRRAGAKASAVVAIVAAAVAAHTLLQAESQRQGQRAPMATLLPPQLVLRAPQDAARFFGDVDALKPSLDRAREEEPAAPGLLPDAFGD